jgi:hypothetical protein
VLRDDGTVWLNLGDSYNAAGRVGHGTRVGFKQGTNRASAKGIDHTRANDDSLKPKDLLMIPARVALALQADGWYLRSDIIWAKPNPMPESVTDRPTSAHEHVFLLAKQPRYFYDAQAIAEPTNGDAAENVEAVQTVRRNTAARGVLYSQERDRRQHLQGMRESASPRMAEVSDWPDSLFGGKCLASRESEDSPLLGIGEGQGGNLPPTCCAPGQKERSDQHPYSAGMGKDQSGSGESLPLLPEGLQAVVDGPCDPVVEGRPSRGIEHCSSVQELQQQKGNGRPHVALRNARNVWTIASQPFAEAHFATFPPALVEPCIKAGTSEKGCCADCGAPWRRVIEQDPCDKAGRIAKGETWGPQNLVSAKANNAGNFSAYSGAKRDLGWSPSCDCPAAPPVPCTVLDPFGGAGTVGLVADRLGRDAVLIELNGDYDALARARIVGDVPLLVVLKTEVGT